MAWIAFFFVSGFCSLLYEVVWLRLAMARYGVTTPLVSIVVSVFMAGLAAGSVGGGALAGRLAGRPSRVALRLYAVAEGAVALGAIVSPRLLDWGSAVLAGGGQEWGSAVHHLIAGGFVAIALLPACLAMGATIPLALLALRSRDGVPAAHAFSRLYLANVLGAAAGTLVTAGVLIELLGFYRTLAVAACGNTLVAACALAFGARGYVAQVPPRGDTVADGPPREHPRAAPVLATLFLTGFASLGMEVAWIRLLTPYLGNLVYGFAMVLALYLLGTAAGTGLYRRGRGWVAQGLPPVFWAVLAVAALCPLVTADPRLPFAPSGAGVQLRVLGRVLRAAVGVIPCSVGFGFVTPLLLDRWCAGEPRRAGTAYGFNIVGGILGPLVAAFLLLPRLGERGTIVALSVPLLAGALLVTSEAAAGVRRAPPFGVVSAAAAAMACVVIVTRGHENSLVGAVTRRDATATVTAAGVDRETKVLLVNGRGMTGLTPITKMMVHLPLAFRARPPRSALVVCFGMGTSYRSALSWGIEATAVELVPSVLAVVGFFHESGDALLHAPRGRVVIDDGRRFLARSPTTYDSIVVDPPPPIEAAGSSLLYSREFYEAARQRLAPDGILQQWIPQDDPVVTSAFLKAVTAVFPHVRVFGSVEGWGIHILASPRPIEEARPEDLAARTPPEAARDLVEWGPASTAAEQYARVLSHEIPPAAILAESPDAPVLVDDRPLNEYFLVRLLQAGGRRHSTSARF